MDNDLISRQAVSSWLKQYGQDVLHGKYKFSLMYIWKNLMDLPPAQPEPHEGYWIEGGIYREVIECNCSECGQLMTTAATVRMNFCPKCGAKMKGEPNE